MKSMSAAAAALSLIMMCSMSVHAGELEYKLIRAARTGDVVATRQLLEQGADINSRDADPNHMTPLHVAAEWGQLDVVRLLIEKGANVNARKDNDETPLHRAAINGEAEVAKLLIAKGAQIDARDEDYRITPLHDAAISGKLEVARVLIDRGADLNAVDKDGRTPLEYATTNSHADVVQLLSEKGSKRKTTAQYLSELRGRPQDTGLRREIIAFAMAAKPIPEISESARRSFMKGAGYMKAAKDISDYKLAIEAYEAALLDAPWWGNAYYNLGKASQAAGELYKAKEAFEMYLLTRPGEADRNDAQANIAEIEVKQELQTKRAAAMKAKYGNRQGGSFGWEDLFRYGAVVQNMSFDASGNERTISLKIVTRKEIGYLHTYFQIADITSRDDTFLQKFSIDWRGADTFYLDDRASPNKELMTLTVTSYGDGDANISIKPANNASASINTSLSALLKELASQAVYAGDKLNIGGRDFYVLGQGGATGSLLFFPPEIENQLEHGTTNDLMPKLVANVNYRGSNGTNESYANTDLGVVNGTHYHLEHIGGQWVARVGRGEEH